jgi:hypothetical protein
LLAAELVEFSVDLGRADSDTEDFAAEEPSPLLADFLSEAEGGETC